MDVVQCEPHERDVLVVLFAFGDVTGNGITPLVGGKRSPFNPAVLAVVAAVAVDKIHHLFLSGKTGNRLQGRFQIVGMDKIKETPPFEFRNGEAEQ